MRDDILGSIRHQAHRKLVMGPQMRNPFANYAKREYKFWKDVSAVHGEGVVPTGYGLSMDESSASEYISVEILEVGAKANRDTRIILPREVWLPRTILWVQALELMYKHARP